MFRLFLVLMHHQREATKIRIAIVIPVPVVAVEAVLIKVAELQAIAVRMKKYCQPSMPPLLEYSRSCIEFEDFILLVGNTGCKKTFYLEIICCSLT